MSTNKLFWLPFPVDEWLTELGAALIPEQKGALVDLLMTAWRMTPPCTLPSDPTYLAARSGLGERWERLGPGILVHFAPHGDGTDGRLVCPWLLEIYEAQLRRYAQRKERNERYRKESETQAETSHGASHGASQRKARQRAGNGSGLHETQFETQAETSHGASHGRNGAVRRAGDVSPSRAKNLELRSSSLSSYELKRATAPEARACADEARAAPGAGPSRNGAPSDDSSTGRAVNSAAAAGDDGPEAPASGMELEIERPVEQEWRGPSEQPTSIAEVLDALRPARKPALQPAKVALARVDAAAEEREAIAFVEAEPAVKQRLLQEVSDEWGTRFKDDAKGDAMLHRVWKSACLLAYRAHASAKNSAEKQDTVPPHTDATSEVSP